MTPEDELYERLKGVEAARPTAPSEGSVVERELTKGDPDYSTPITIQNLFTHQDVHPIVLDFALLRAFGLDWFGWETPTIWAEVRRVFKTSLAELTRAKIQTVKSCHVSNLPWEKWQVFEKVVQGLNNNVPRFDLMQAPGLEQLYVAIDILEGIRKQNFSDEVKLYMAAAVLHEDVTFVPPPLDFIQVEVSHPHYVCLDCGNEDSALFHDGLCDTCTRKYDLANGLGMRPDPDALAAGKGRNVKLVLRHDPDKVQELWEKVKTKATGEVADSLEETPEDVQVAKLLVARDYMNVRRRQLADQLTALKTWLGANS
jgi:hypothetical protein